jgi:hypothetical protein
MRSGRASTEGRCSPVHAASERIAVYAELGL